MTKAFPQDHSPQDQRSKFSDAACWLRVAVRLNTAEPGGPSTREITEHFHRAAEGLDREALVAHAARRKAPNAPPSEVAAIERELWRKLVTFSGWPEALRNVEPEGRA